jgi:cell division protein FtsQ
VAERRRSADVVATVRGDVLALPRASAAPPGLRPSTRSLLASVLLLALAAAAYLIARESSAFALRTVEVEGVPPALSAKVRQAVAPLVGGSLVALDRSDATRRVLALPEVASVSVDRDFPHTLRISVVAARPAAVLRQADRAWLVSADARVLGELAGRPYPALPRIWLPRTGSVLVGSTLSGDPAQAARVAAVVAGTRFPAPVLFVRASPGQLTLALRSGLYVRLGDASDLVLKLAVAARIARLAPDARYLDVTVPERVVAAYESQVEG